MLSYQITDAAVRKTLSRDKAYQLVSGRYVQSLPPVVKFEALNVYLEALKTVWYGAIAFGASELITVAFEKHVPLRTDLVTEYELQEEKVRDREDGMKVAELHPDRMSPGGDCNATRAPAALS